MTPVAGDRLIIVDGANVVGSRPDGWWRDRAGAARRLHDQLVAADLGTEVILVLEGRARAGVEEGALASVTTRHAPADGDGSIVELVDPSRDGVLVVTADRGLADRVRARGATVVGPSWLLDRLQPADDRSVG